MLGQSLLVAVLLGILFGDLKDGKGRWTRRRGLRPEIGQPAVPAGGDQFLVRLQQRRQGDRQGTHHLHARARFQRPGGSYYCSKFLLLMLFSGLQAVVLAGHRQALVRSARRFRGPVSVLLTGLAAAGVALGLAISAAAPTEEMAITLIPVAVIPQIILSGVIAPLEGLSKSGADVHHGLLGQSRSGRPADRDSRPSGRPGARLVHGRDPGLCCLHAGVCVVVALGMLCWQGRGARAVGALCG